MYSIFSCRFWTMATSPTPTAAKVNFENTVIVMTSNAGSNSKSGQRGL